MKFFTQKKIPRANPGKAPRSWRFWSLALALAFSLATQSLSARAEESDDSSDEDAPAAVEAPKPQPKRKRRLKDPYKRSQLTRDESEGKADKRPLLLSTGEDKAVDLTFEANAGANGIAIGNPAVVATTLVKVGDKRQIVFKPLKAGETTVTVRDADGTLRLIFKVVVTPSNILRRAGEMRELLRDIEGIDVKIVGQKIIIDGEVLVPSDYGRLLSVITDKAYSDVVMNLTTLSPLAMQVLAKRIQEDVNSFAPNVRTRVVNGVIFLEGAVDNKDAADRAIQIARVYLPEVKPGNPIASRDPSAQSLAVGRQLVQTFIVINPPPPKKQERLVRVTVNFVELAKDYNKVFGFKWQPGFGTANGGEPQVNIGGNNTSGPSLSATISNLFPKLQSAQQAGYARILKTGTVIVRSGQPAELNEQTEFPFTIIGANGQPQAASKGVGLKVAVTPLILGQSEDIQLDLDLNQVNLTGRAPASGTAPIVANHNVKTKIYVKSTESAAVAGVMSSDIGTDFNKDDPQQGSFAGNTDALFTLLHSKAYRKKRSQFVIFVTPQIVENASEGTEDLKKNFRVRVK